MDIAPLQETAKVDDMKMFFYTCYSHNYLLK